MKRVLGHKEKCKNGLHCLVMLQVAIDSANGASRNFLDMMYYTSLTVCSQYAWEYWGGIDWDSLTSSLTCSVTALA